MDRAEKIRLAQKKLRKFQARRSISNSTDGSKSDLNELVIPERDETVDTDTNATSPFETIFDDHHLSSLSSLQEEKPKSPEPELPDAPVPPPVAWISTDPSDNARSPSPPKSPLRNPVDEDNEQLEEPIPGHFATIDTEQQVSDDSTQVHLSPIPFMNAGAPAQNEESTSSMNPAVKRRFSRTASHDNIPVLVEQNKHVKTSSTATPSTVTKALLNEPPNPFTPTAEHVVSLMDREIAVMREASMHLDRAVTHADGVNTDTQEHVEQQLLQPMPPAPEPLQQSFSISSSPIPGSLPTQVPMFQISPPRMNPTSHMAMVDPTNFDTIIEAYRSEIANLQLQISQRDTLLEQRFDDFKRTHTKLTVAKDMIGNLSSELKKAKLDSETQSKDNNSLISERADLHSKITELEGTKEHLTKQVLELEHVCDEQMARLRTFQSRDESGVNADVNGKSEDRQDNNVDVKRLSELESREVGIVQREKALTELTKRIELREVELVGKEKRVIDISDESVKLEHRATELDQLEKSLDQLRELLDEREESINKRETTLTTTFQELNSRQSALSVLETDLQRRQLALQTSLEEVQSREVALLSSIEEREAQMESARQAFMSQQQALDARIQQVNQKEMEMEKLDRECREREVGLDSARNEMETKWKQRELAIAERETELRGWKESLEALEKKLIEKEKSLNNLDANESSTTTPLKKNGRFNLEHLESREKLLNEREQLLESRSQLLSQKETELKRLETDLKTKEEDVEDKSHSLRQLQVDLATTLQTIEDREMVLNAERERLKTMEKETELKMAMAAQKASSTSSTMTSPTAAPGTTVGTQHDALLSPTFDNTILSRQASLDKLEDELTNRERNLMERERELLNREQNLLEREVSFRSTNTPSTSPERQVRGDKVTNGNSSSILDMEKQIDLATREDVLQKREQFLSERERTVESRLEVLWNKEKELQTLEFRIQTTKMELETTYSRKAVELDERVKKEWSSIEVRSTKIRELEESHKAAMEKLDEQRKKYHAKEKELAEWIAKQEKLQEQQESAKTDGSSSPVRLSQSVGVSSSKRPYLEKQIAKLMMDNTRLKEKISNMVKAGHEDFRVFEERNKVLSNKVQEMERLSIASSNNNVAGSQLSLDGSSSSLADQRLASAIEENRRLRESLDQNNLELAKLKKVLQKYFMQRLQDHQHRQQQTTSPERESASTSPLRSQQTVSKATATSPENRHGSNSPLINPASKRDYDWSEDQVRALQSRTERELSHVTDVEQIVENKKVYELLNVIVALTNTNQKLSAKLANFQLPYSPAPPSASTAPMTAVSPYRLGTPTVPFSSTDPSKSPIHRAISPAMNNRRPPSQQQQHQPRLQLFSNTLQPDARQSRVPNAAKNSNATGGSVVLYPPMSAFPVDREPFGGRLFSPYDGEQQKREEIEQVQTVQDAKKPPSPKREGSSVSFSKQSSASKLASENKSSSVSEQQAARKMERKASLKIRVGSNSSTGNGNSSRASTAPSTASTAASGNSTNGKKLSSSSGQSSASGSNSAKSSATVPSASALGGARVLINSNSSKSLMGPSNATAQQKPNGDNSRKPLERMNSQEMLDEILQRGQRAIEKISGMSL